jgi:predicted RNA-binding protein YlqC (UPF0109 family)
MTNETTATMALLREILGGLIANPEHLRIEAREFPGAVYWTIRVQADDYGKVVGKAGAHIQAIAFILDDIGRAIETTYAVTLPEPEAAPRRPNLPPVSSENYDPEPARDLLERTLAPRFADTVCVETVIPTDGQWPYYRFVVTVREKDFAELVSPRDFVMGNKTLRNSLVDSLGTLWRARGQKEGVKLMIEPAFSTT